MLNVPPQIIRRKEDIHFEFEDFLAKHEKALPRDIEPEQAELLEKLRTPLKNPQSIIPGLKELPLKALLNLPWKPYLQIMLLIFMLYIPSFVLLGIGFKFLGIPLGPIVIVMVIGIVGYWAGAFTLKFSFSLFQHLLEVARFPWIADAVKDPLESAYRKNRTKKTLTLALLLMGLPTVLFIVKFFDQLSSGATSGSNAILGLVLSILSLLFVVPAQAVLLLSLIMSQKNTTIYDHLLQPIKNRVVGYNEGFESILTKNNYEVVMILGDTPGHSIRELGDIPLVGLASLVLVLNAFVYNLMIPIIGEVNDLLIKAQQDNTPIIGWLVTRFSPIGFLFFMLLLITVLASLTTIVLPLIKLWWVIRKFRLKALSELDPFLFDEITDTALGRKEKMEEEAHVVFALREYIYQMKTSPVDPIRLAQITILYTFYVWRGLPKIAG